jgi:hypothetical protein
LYSEQLPGWLVVAVEMLLAGLTGLLLLALGADGGSWILGGILAGALVFFAYRQRWNPNAKPNRTARKVGQMLVGLTVGFSLRHSDLVGLSSSMPIFVMLALFLMVAGGAIGYGYSRVERTDALTGMLATSPGNIGVMASIAADYGKNATLVSLVQLMRFTAITFVVPLMANVTQPHTLRATLNPLTPGALEMDPTYWLWLVGVLVTAGVAARLGGKMKIPVAALLCPIAVGAVFNSLVNSVPWLPSVEFSLPPLLNLVGQILLGITIGEYWGMNPRFSRFTITRALLPTLLTFVVGVLAAGIAKLLTPWDWLTCLLVTAPGGSPEMIWIALGLGHNVDIVTAGHLVRLIALNVTLPVLVLVAQRLDQRLPTETRELRSDL